MKEEGDCLQPIEAHDILCHVSDAIMAGGIRRSAAISFFSADDDEMISCKSGNWSETNPQRGRANNSAVLVRHKITKEFFENLWNRIKASNAGEPGIYFTNDKDMLSNPCVEASLKAETFCNLSEIDGSTISSQEDFEERVKAAAFIGTLQASYTDFHYLRDSWKRNVERDALLGVSMTGIASNKIFAYDIKKAALVAVEENKRVAEILEISPAARILNVKPAGTSSLVLGTSSGIHAWHDEYYIRRMRVGKNEAIYHYLMLNHPELLEDDFFKPHSTAIICVPQKAPEGAILRDESPMNLLERIKTINNQWIKPGHNRGSNQHNVSATVSIKEDEWEMVGNWMWENRKFYNGISVLPFDNGSYTQPPFESCSKEIYEKMMESLKEVDLTKIIEFNDDTDLQGEAACGAGGCVVS